jgi:transcriptional regulator with XRE-family HTH domain
VSCYVSRLITELLALADSWGWSLADLAKELGVDVTTVMHYRAGRRRLTKVMLGRIARRFREQQGIRDLVWHHLLVETLEEEGDGGELALDLPPTVLQTLSTYVDRFADESIHAGRGLYLRSDDTASLARAVVAVDRAFGAAGVQTYKVRADHVPTAADRRSALAARALIVERVEFATPPMVDLLNERANLVRPMIVTSTIPPETTSDAYLQRVFLSMTRRIDIGTASVPPPHVTPDLTSPHAAT